MEKTVTHTPSPLEGPPPRCRRLTHATTHATTHGTTHPAFHPRSGPAHRPPRGPGRPRRRCVVHATRRRVRRYRQAAVRRWRREPAARPGDAGMTTAEYAVGTLAAAAFAAVLYKVVTSSQVTAALRALVERALDGGL